MRAPARAGSLALAALLLLAVAWTQWRLVSLTNFFGYDEWTVLTLVTRRIMDIPYANRPLALLWTLPVPLLGADSFFPFAILGWVYAWGSALLVAHVALRVCPGRPLLAFLAGTFVLVWAPSDRARLSLVENSEYWGITFGMMLSLALFVESWVRRRIVLLAVAGALAVVSGRCYESTLPVLGLCPLLLLVREERLSRALAGWAAAFGGFVGVALGLAVVPMFAKGQTLAYQKSFALDAQLLPMVDRLLQQYAYHFLPVVLPELAQIRPFAVAAVVGVAVFVVAVLAWQAAVPAEGSRGRLGWLIPVGLLLAGAGYTALVVTSQVTGAWRAEFLSAPGAALFLAALACGLGEASRGAGRIVTLAFAAWIVAVGSARTAALDAGWRMTTFYPRQMQVLSTLVEVVPDTLPGTLIVMTGDTRAWRANFTFHHAVEYLYRDAATGLVPGAIPAMLPGFFTLQGIASEPLAVVRGPWRAPARLFPYDHLVVVRATDTGLTLLDAWPAELPPLPAGARYAPLLRVRPLASPLAPRGALRSLERR